MVHMPTRIGFLVEQGRFPLYIILYFLVASSLMGCSMRPETASLAPPPPEFNPLNTPDPLASIEPAAGMFMEKFDDIPALTLTQKQSITKRCSMKQRFDRKDLVAYEWNNNRLGFDIDGVGLGSISLDGGMLVYKMKLQAIKPKKSNCRYKSGFQGLVGSGYNEFFRREGNTVWHELDMVAGDAQSYLRKFVE